MTTVFILVMRYGKVAPTKAKAFCMFIMEKHLVNAVVLFV